MDDVLWTPDEQYRRQSNMQLFCDYLFSQGYPRFGDYPSLHQWSIDYLNDFWLQFWRFSDLKALTEPKVGFTGDPGNAEQRGWFPDIKLNYAENLLRFATAKPDRVIAVTVNEQGVTREITGECLYQQVAAVASALRTLGIAPGDRVAGYLNHSHEALVAMLATTAIGAVWSSASPDFGAAGIIDRFGQISPKVVFANTRYRYGGKEYDRRREIKELVDALSPSLSCVIPIESGVAVDIQCQSLSWKQFIEQGVQANKDAKIDYFHGLFDHPLFILFSSGTTGKPKCIVHGAGGTLLQHAKELQLHTNLTMDSVFSYFTTTGWMMWNFQASALLTGAKLIIFDGHPGYPDSTRLWRLIEQFDISHLGTSAKYISSCRIQNIPVASLRMTSLQMLLSTGSPLQPEDFDWVYQYMPQVHLASISGGTDIVSCFVLGNPFVPVRRGRIQGPGLAMNLRAYDDHGNAVIGQKGELVCLNPVPSMPVCFWNDKHHNRYRECYFNRYPGVWVHGDYIEFDQDGSAIIYGRSDTTLNPGGVRIGTAEIYRQVETITGVLDSLVVGMPEAGDIVIVLMVKLTAETVFTVELVENIKSIIRRSASPRHVPKYVFQVSDIPYTRSGKKVELAALNALTGRSIENQSALANPEILDEIAQLFPSVPKK
ncbi:acetoacetate--CoA ligase [Gynuella sp.]|uniref:acetoacetate--CoA ligase n=1 Tax=Gynuella sp. TaxID=2969146 RepID=UPI003D14F82F